MPESESADADAGDEAEHQDANPGSNAAETATEAGGFDPDSLPYDLDRVITADPVIVDFDALDYLDRTGEGVARLSHIDEFRGRFKAVVTYDDPDRNGGFGIAGPLDAIRPANDTTSSSRER